jgi:hypothetical protein
MTTRSGRLHGVQHSVRMQADRQYGEDCGGLTFVNCLRVVAEVPASGARFTPSGMVAL